MTDRQKAWFAALALVVAGLGLIGKTAYAAPPVWLEKGSPAPTPGYLLSVEDATKCAQSVVHLKRCEGRLVTTQDAADETLKHCERLHAIDKGALNVCRSKLLDPDRGRPEVIREVRWGWIVGGVAVGLALGLKAGYEWGALD